MQQANKKVVRRQARTKIPGKDAPGRQPHLCPVRGKVARATSRVMSGRSRLPPAENIWSAAVISSGCRRPTTLRRFCRICSMSPLTGAMTSLMETALLGTAMLPSMDRDAKSDRALVASAKGENTRRGTAVLPLCTGRGVSSSLSLEPRACAVILCSWRCCSCWCLGLLQSELQPLRRPCGRQRPVWHSADSIFVECASIMPSQAHEGSCGKETKPRVAYQVHR